MFQLCEMILASPIGAFIWAGLQDSLYAILIVADCDDVFRGLRRKRIPLRVAKDPKKDHQDKPRPHIKRRNKNSALRFSGERTSGESEKTINDEWQR